MPAANGPLTAKFYVDNAIDESTLVRKFQSNDLNNFNLTNKNSITLSTPAVIDIQVMANAYVGQFHNVNEKNRRDLGLDFYNESSDSVRYNQGKTLNNIKSLDSITINRNPIPDNEVSKNIY